MSVPKKSKYVFRCKLSIGKQKELINLFLSGCTARAAAMIVSVNRNTATLFFRKLRQIIANRKKHITGGEVEVDETYLSGGEGGRKKAKQGRNLAGKIALVGVVERHTRRLHIERVESTASAVLESFCSRNIETGSIVHTDSFKAYNHIKKLGFHHKRVNHSKGFKTKRTKACTNLIESVWAFAKRHFARFAGGWRNNLNLWIAELEFRFEHKHTYIAEFKKLLAA